MSGARIASAPPLKRKPAKRHSGANDNSRRRRELVQPGHDYLFPDEIRARNIGRPFDPVKWADGHERREDLLRQSHWIADALERQGIRAREQADEASDIDHVLGTVTPVERFRSIKFLPLVMQRDSAAMLAALRFYMHNHVHGQYVRMATITGGSRVPAFGPLRKRHDIMTRAISKWASIARMLYGVEVLFRSMEYTRDPGTPGTLETPAEPPSYHEHGHILFTPTEYIGELGWDRFLAWSHAYLCARMPGTVYAFHDCNRIKEPDEACKYPFKPGELSRCTDAEISWLQTEFYRANMKQPMGSFRSFNRTMSENTRQTGEVIETMDPETGEITQTHRTVRAPLKIVTVYPDAGEAPPLLQIVHKRRKPKRGDRDEVRELDDKKHEPKRRENYILFTGNPTSSSCPWATVKSRVVGYTETPTTQAGHEGLHDLNCITFEVMAAWEKRGAPPPLRIPLLMERDAAAMESKTAQALAESERWRLAHDVDCPTSAHSMAVKDAATAANRARRLRALAAHLRASMTPTEPGTGATGSESHAYSVHTCSLTVPAFYVGGEATSVQFSPESFLAPLRSDFEVTESLSVQPIAAPVSVIRPSHTLPAYRWQDENTLLLAPLKICAAVRDYEAWWQANRGKKITESERPMA